MTGRFDADTGSRRDRLRAALAISAALALAAQSAPSAGAEAELAPHRAVYDVTLASTSVGAGITELTGRMVYELTGSNCAGYTQKMRLVTRTANSEGNQSLSDMRSSYFEDLARRRFTFSTENFQDERLSESSAGSARVPSDGDGQMRIEITMPRRKHMAVPADGVLFPVAHSIELLEAARAGKRTFRADIFDGSEKGEKVFDTTAAIGRGLPVGANGALADAEGAAVLDGLRAWPVSLSYFEKANGRDDAAPTYELAFLFFDNGVSRRLVIDYGAFAIKGRLTSLEMLKPAPCK